eukprot:CAMPEP_0181231578 /NCGR_PEP_ID=MMETSP1096-20121128/35194_1 /TAXON_ID=156174 ORGANISM="Chrysochromulina ericina, Strain CCMP281" /NCGR_SAMPLE_ID=MMETSP1096 /ASSEMBLY_ACC=CAM_ASM_000453 /LENGTH=136 /DNA_ID=CAMNT_0023325655 /DNA_START=134 /DNA_END=540 /DNA_ORIENTATION=+
MLCGTETEVCAVVGPGPGAEERGADVAGGLRAPSQSNIWHMCSKTRLSSRPNQSKCEKDRTASSANACQCECATSCDSASLHPRPSTSQPRELLRNDAERGVDVLLRVVEARAEPKRRRPGAVRRVKRVVGRRDGA